jgi:hypothetical protein
MNPNASPRPRNNRETITKKTLRSLPSTCHLFPPLLPKKQDKGERKEREEHIYITRTYRQQVVHILLAHHGNEFLRSRHGETQEGQEQQRTKEEL